MIFVVSRFFKDIDKANGKDVSDLSVQVTPSIKGRSVIAIDDFPTDEQNVREVVAMHLKEFVITRHGTTIEVFDLASNDPLLDIASHRLELSSVGFFHDVSRLVGCWFFVKTFLELFDNFLVLFVSDAKIFFDPFIPIGSNVAERVVNHTIHNLILFHCSSI
jgi:hypothetical protein